MTSKTLCFGLALGALAACNPGASDTATRDAAAATEAEAPVFAVNAQGIMPDGTPASLIAFGANSLDTIEAATAVLGEDFDQDESDECGSGPMQFADWGALWLTFQYGEFVGWELRDGAAGARMRLTNGATVGSSRGRLEAAFGVPVTVEESTLGHEFVLGGISGLLSDDARDATVTAL